jgi:hypothetical protein
MTDLHFTWHKVHTAESFIYWRAVNNFVAVFPIGAKWGISFIGNNGVPTFWDGVTEQFRKPVNSKNIFTNYHKAIDAAIDIVRRNKK